MKDLFLSLLYSQSESEVHRIVQSNKFLKDSQNWKPYGGETGNYSSFENQQSTPEGALMEKNTNSIDAILVRQCLLKGIVPSSKDAPKTMEQAVNTLFTKEELQKEKVLVITDGSQNEVNVMVVDDGEGQQPDKFEETLLSLQKGNKNSIKFVQGKFNMGSTGAVVFCGKYKYQLIASRRHSKLEPSSDVIGFTLVRKHVRSDKEKELYKNTWYEFCTIAGKIPRFNAEKIPLVQGNSNFIYEQGTIVKMYNYDLPSKTQSFQSLKNEINRLLYFPAFHIHVHESRQHFAQVRERGGITNIAYGNGHSLRNESISKRLQESIEYKSIKNELIDSTFGKAEIDIYVFKEKDKTFIKDYRGKTPIVFLMNGQVQYSENTTFITSKLGLKLIKDSIIVIIDCTNLSKEFMDEGLFMANRETIRKNSYSKYFMDKVTDFLKTHPELDRLNRERASQQVSSSSTKQLLENLLGKNAQDNILRNLFKDDALGMKNPNDNTGTNGRKDKEQKLLKEFPTYMQVKNGEENEEGEKVFAQPINKSMNIKIEIDAVDNYFTRDENPGDFGLKIRNAKKQTSGGRNAPGDGLDYGEGFSIKKTSLHNGTMNIELDPKDSELSVGDEVVIQIHLNDINQHFSHLVKVRLIEPAVEKDKPKEKKKEKLELPPLVQVYKDQQTIDDINRPDEEKQYYQTWEQLDWNLSEGKKKVVYLQPSIGDQPVGTIFINMNSHVLEKIMTEEGTTGTRSELVQHQFLMQLYMQSFLFSAAFAKIQKKQSEMDEVEFELERIEAEKFIEKIIEETAYLSIKMQLNNIKNSTEAVTV